MGRPFAGILPVIGVMSLQALLAGAQASRAQDVKWTLVAAPERGSTALGDRAQVERDPASNERIRSLIEQLGDARYASRRAAANELQRIGAEAFDLLHEATAHVDPEIASSAHYLLRQISVRWVRSSDSILVRALLKDFDKNSDDDRLERIKSLAKLPEGEGAAALCRIARYDRSPLVSRNAALAIIRPDIDTASQSSLDVQTMERELGASTREAATWLRRFAMQRDDPAEAITYWQSLVNAEKERLLQNSGDTSPEIVIGLLWNLAELHRGLDDEEAVIAQIDAMLEVDSEETQQTLIELVDWTKKHKAWAVLDDLLNKHQARFESKRPLYHAAMARATQGKQELAEELAAQASKIDSRGSLESFITAKELEENRQFDWAVREYHRSIDDKPVASHEAVLSRVYLANLLHDYEQHKAAADVLRPLVEAVQNEGQIGKLYAELLRYYRGRLALPEADEAAGRLHFYLACHYREELDRKRERDELELAIKFDPANADVLIAMYRLPDQDEAWKNSVQQRIEALCAKFQKQIDDNPNDPSAYNQWAWLVSNTEGDFQKAIRYSHRSIELIPPGAGPSAGASFLDTLGRCYYAAGDLENAVKYQRQAIAKLDYMQVMHRQLALFEKAIAASKQANP